MNEDFAPVITVDGPSGSGKGTLSQRLATALGWHYLDSGALYRVLAYVAQEQGIGPTDETRLPLLVAQMDVNFAPNDAGTVSVLRHDQDITHAIRKESCGAMASKISAFPGVRGALLTAQREFRRMPGLVTDGRDMGTVVFPEAPLKLFLEASAHERAKRRASELQKRGLSVILRDIEREICERDERDASRSVAPMVAAPDAIVMDTTKLSPDQVFKKVHQLAQQRLGIGADD